METPGRPGRSVGAVVAGAVAAIALSIGSDALLQADGVFPPPGQRASDGPLLLATLYRSVYGVLGGYIAARLAPRWPMRHALALGVLGFAASTAGAMVTWNGGPA